MQRIAFESFSVVTPSGWQVITDSVEADDPPATLARGDGVGALQFSIALHTSGPVPDPGPDALGEIIVSFGHSHNLGQASDVSVESGPLRLAAGSFAWDDDFVRVWQVCDGRNFALITYTCELEHEGRELVQCEQIVRSLQFQVANERA